MAVSKGICESLTDKEIISKSLEQVEYFACLYDRYEPRFQRYIQKISVCSREEANDILQDAFIKIWKNLNNYDDGLKLSSWLYRIVHNETISFCRKKRSYGKSNVVEIDNSNLINLAEEQPDEIDPEEKYFLTHQVLDQLELKYREVLILKFLEKMSYDEISDVLKIPEGTVAIRINRAKKVFIKLADKQNISFIG